MHSINLQPNIIHVSSNFPCSSVLVGRFVGNYVLLPETSIHMSIHVKHERADSSTGLKDLKVTKFIYATPTDIHNVRWNELQETQEKKGSRHSAKHSRTVSVTLGNSGEQTRTGPGRSTYKEKHGLESKRQSMETNTRKAGMSRSYTDKSRTTILR